MLKEKFYFKLKETILLYFILIALYYNLKYID